MRTFHLVRSTDVSGSSGTGIVAEGVEFTDGTCVLRWLSGLAGACSTGVYGSVADVIAIHGHGNATVLRYEDTFTSAAA